MLAASFVACFFNGKRNVVCGLLWSLWELLSCRLAAETLLWLSKGSRCCVWFTFTLLPCTLGYCEMGIGVILRNAQCVFPNRTYKRNYRHGLSPQGLDSHYMVVKVILNTWKKATESLPFFILPQCNMKSLSPCPGQFSAQILLLIPFHEDINILSIST